MGIPDHITFLLKTIYADQEATVRTGHGTTDCLQIGNGVCQGCILSLCLFNLYTGSAQLVQSLSRVWLSATPWIAACQASLSITNSQSSLKLMSIKSVMQPSHLIFCHPLLLLPPIPPSIRVFSNESTLRIRWPKDWSFNFSISPSIKHPGLISFRMDWLDHLAVQGTLKVFSNTTVQKHQLFGALLSSQLKSHIHTWPQEKPYPWLDRPLLAK